MGQRKTTAAKNKRRIRTRRSNARNQKRQILSNQNQILAIRNHLNLSKERIRWHCGNVEIPMNAYPLIIPLTSGPNPTSPAFCNTVAGTDSMAWSVTMTPGVQDALTSRNKIVVNKQYVDLSVLAHTEAGLLNHTAFLVSLAPDNATQVYTETSAMHSLTKDTDYAVPVTAAGVDTGYGPYLNTDRFNIIKRLEFETAGVWPISNAGNTTGNVGEGTNSFYIKRCQFKINYGSTIMSASGDGATTGGSLPYAEIKPHQKRFIILFSNNSLVDGEYPQINISLLVTGYALE